MARSVAFVVCEGGLLPRRPVALTDLVPAPGSLAALQRLSAAGFAIAVLGETPAAAGNAGGARTPVAKTPDTGNPEATGAAIDAATADAFLGRLLGAQGAPVAELRRCRHAAETLCDCRLPGLGLVRDFVADPSLDRSRSIVIGGESALALAANMGLRGFAVGRDGSADWQAVVHAVLDAPRTASVERRTRETSIDVTVDLDRPAAPSVRTGIGFFDHMLEQLGKHGGFALGVTCDGDLEVDEHHTVEDVALAIGEALRRALGAKLGIERYGFVLPMDEARAQVQIDLSGRAYFVFNGSFARESVGGLPTELVPHFFRSVADALGATVHLQVVGDNDHHKIEASFKAFARALRQAVRRQGDELPSTKGTL